MKGKPGEPMSQYPTPGGGPNQTLIELILAIKGLAQTFELAHASLKNLIESDTKTTARELDRIRDMLSKNNQALSVLPITVSDRVEKLVNNLEKDLDEKIEAKGEAVPEELLEGPRQITGRVEVRRDGTVDVRLQTVWIQRLIMGLKISAVGAGGYGVIEILRQAFGL
jgi:plasmid maintenance system antidote protein VapI